MWSGYAGTVVSLLQAGIMTRERAAKEIQGINKQARDHAGDNSSDPENESPEGCESSLPFLFTLWQTAVNQYFKSKENQQMLVDESVFPCFSRECTL